MKDSPLQERARKILYVLTHLGILVLCAFLFYFSNMFAFKGGSFLAGVLASEPYLQKTPREYILSETTNPEKSSSESFWLNSGGLFYPTGTSSGKTIQGDLPSHSFWRVLYSFNNPKDSERGFRPQNIFRLVTKSKIADIEESVYVQITQSTQSSSVSRNESNGVFLMSRYSDANNLYYGGIRVDGAVVIKKKQGGVYTTLALEPYFEGVYDRNNNSNLLPQGKWIGLKTRTYDIHNIATVIELYIDEEKTGVWKKVQTAYDVHLNSTNRISREGFGGIRSDFMDIEIENFQTRNI